MSRPTASRTAPRPVGLLVLAAITGLEALAVAVVAVLALLSSPFGSGVTSGIAVAVFVLLLAVLLVALTIGLTRARPWTRSASLVWQLVQALVGVYALSGTGGALLFGLIALGLAVAALVLLFIRPVRAALARPVTGSGSG